MALIDDPDKARRLARAICADIVLYEGARVRAAVRAERAESLQRPVAEGRALYVSRVTPELYDLFDEALAAMTSQLGSGPVPLGPPAGEGHPRVERDEQPAAGMRLVLLLVLALAVLGMGAAAFLLVAR